MDKEYTYVGKLLSKLTLDEIQTMVAQIAEEEEKTGPIFEQLDRIENDLTKALEEAASKTLESLEAYANSTQKFNTSDEFNDGFLAKLSAKTVEDFIAWQNKYQHE